MLLVTSSLAVNHKKRSEQAVLRQNELGITKRYFDMFRKKIRLRDLLLIVALLFILIIILGNRNILLRKEFRKIQETSYIFNSTERTKLAQQITKDIIIVKNDKVGLLDKEKKKSTLHLVRELILGEKGGDPNLTFYQIWPIIPDNSGNIYVCSRFDRQITKFSQKGDFLLSFGKEGKGAYSGETCH